MKKNYSILLLVFLSTALQSQPNPDWMYFKPTNTGLGGDYYQCIETDRCGNKWTGGYMPFWSEGSVVKFDDSVFTCWSNTDGYLPADRVYDIAFDNAGGLWVATNDVGAGIAHGGISHFDGSTWTTYTTVNSPLPEDDMRGIAVDANDVVWATFYNVGTGIGGVARFDGTSWNIYTPSNSGLPVSYSDKIDCDNMGNVWIGTNAGLVKFDGTNWTVFTTANSGLSNNDVTDVEFDETTGRIYVAAGISVDIYNIGTWSHINSTNSPVSSTGLWAVDARHDSVIITTIGGTYLTYVYDGITWSTHPENNHVYDARIDYDGNFWTCGISALEKFDGTSWTHYDRMNAGLNSMFNDDVFVDSRNRAWFGSADNGGFNMLDCPNWKSFGPNNSGMWPQPVSYTGFGTGITEDSYGDLWLAYNGSMGAAVQITGGNIDNSSAWHTWDNSNSGISLGFLYRAAADHSGNVWFGYDQACSVAEYSHATNSWTNYNLYALGQTTCGAGSGIRSIRVDDSDNVWICGLAGLAKYDQVNWTFYSFLNTPMLQGYVFDIAFDAAGNKWIATEHGLYRFDGVNWTHYDHTNTPMRGDIVTAVVAAANGMVWVASHEELSPYTGSVSSFNGSAWTAYTMANSGLQANTIARMAEDTLGNLWLMSDTYGAALFKPGGVSGYSCLQKSLGNCMVTSVVAHPLPADAAIMLYPNPAATWCTAEFSFETTGIVRLEIIDVTGRNVLSIAVPPGTGKQKYTFPTAAFAPGVYSCEVSNGTEKRRGKFVID